MQVLIFGATGMLGSAAYGVFAESAEFDVVGAVRSSAAARLLPQNKRQRLIYGVDVESQDSLMRAFLEAEPDLVINAVGVIKQLQSAKDPLTSIPINSLLPHRLANLCAMVGARLIHVSTDCVFTGQKGLYTEADLPDALDLYGRSKLMGEVDAANAITLRTSIIGEELAGGANGLVGWFLAQKGTVKGYRRAVFSGFPTVRLARIMRDVVAPRPDLHGLFHVSADPINKFDLLCLVRDAYGRDTEIIPDEALVIDRSLDSQRFRTATCFQPTSWPDLIDEMRAASSHYADR